MYARILSALALTALSTSATAQSYAPFEPYTSPPWDYMIELQTHIDDLDYPLWQYTRGTIAGATAMSTLGNDGQPMICTPANTTNFDLLFVLGEYLLAHDLITTPEAILELVAPLAAMRSYPCASGSRI